MRVEEFRALARPCLEWIQLCNDEQVLTAVDTIVNELSMAIAERVPSRQPFISMLAETVGECKELAHALHHDDLYAARDLALSLVDYVDELQNKIPAYMSDPPEEGTYPPPSISHDPSWEPVGPIPTEYDDEHDDEPMVPPSVEDWNGDTEPHD